MPIRRCEVGRSRHSDELVVEKQSGNVSLLGCFFVCRKLSWHFFGTFFKCIRGIIYSAKSVVDQDINIPPQKGLVPRCQSFLLCIFQGVW